MALFFDAAWFDARLEQRRLTRATLAVVCGLSEAEVALLFKDQRELKPNEVVVFAELLGADPAEIADRAGVSTRAPTADPLEARLKAIEERLARIEAMLTRRT